MTRLEGLKLLVDARRRTISHKYAEALRHHDRIQVHTAEAGRCELGSGHREVRQSSKPSNLTHIVEDAAQLGERGKRETVEAGLNTGEAVVSLLSPHLLSRPLSGASPAPGPALCQ